VEISTMARGRPPLQTLSVGQLARRWGVSVDRVRQMVAGGLLAGSFTIPSAGRYGTTLRIPLDTVLRAEEDWAVVPQPAKARPKPRRHGDDSGPALRHFPKLAPTDPPGGESPGAAPG
jgi:hypothetical protein